MGERKREAKISLETFENEPDYGSYADSESDGIRATQTDVISHLID